MLRMKYTQTHYYSQHSPYEYNIIVCYSHIVSLVQIEKAQRIDFVTFLIPEKLPLTFEFVAELDII